MLNYTLRTDSLWKCLTVYCDNMAYNGQLMNSNDRSLVTAGPGDQLTNHQKFENSEFPIYQLYVLSANLNCPMNNYFSLTLHFLCPKLNYIFSFAPIKCIVCLGGCRIRKGWDDSLPLGGKSFQWCVALMDFSLVSTHYLHNSVACVPNKLDYYAPTPSFLGTQIYSLRTQSFLSFLSKFVFLKSTKQIFCPCW